MEEQNQNEWATTDAAITTEALDEAVKKMKAARECYEAASKVKQTASDVLDGLENSLIDILKRAGKSKYIVDDIGTVSIMNKYSVKTPKETHQKDAFFGWIRSKYGEDTLKAMLSINSQTLNAFVNEAKTNEPLIEIPGLDAPTHSEIIRFTSKK